MKNQKILIIRFSSIGDIVLTTPIIKSLRKKYPTSTIHFLTKKKFSSILSNNKKIDKVIEFNSQKQNIFKFFKFIKKEKYSIFIDLSNNLRSRILTFFTGFSNVKVFRFSKSSIKRRLQVKFHRFLPKKIVPVYLRYFQAIKELKLKIYSKYEINFTQENEDKILHFIKKDKKNIVVATSATYFTKKWRKENYVNLCKELVKTNNINLIGGTREKSENRFIEKSVAGINNLTGKLTLLETAALLKNSSVLVCHDSGIMHIAQSQNCPVVTLFGSTTNHLGFFPINSNCTAIEVDLPCRPCSVHGRKNCPKVHFQCMRGITVEMVRKAIEKHL